jgi:predicted nucleotide-binding protein with TIR-like domain
MRKGRPAGLKNRNYPPMSLDRALIVARTIEHEASGMTTSRLTLAELLDSTPTSRVFKDMVASSRFYGLTTGGINADEFALTDLGARAASDDPDESGPALKEAVMNVAPYKIFFVQFKGKKVPTPKPMNDFLVRDAGIDEERAEEASAYILSDAKTAGLVRKVKNADWVDLSGTPAPRVGDDEDGDDDVPEPELDVPDADDGGGGGDHDGGGGDEKHNLRKRARPNAIFVGHGKNKKPRDQLTKILGQYGIPFKVAEDEPNRGRPIPIKVKETMEECGAAILIFSADEELFDKDGESVWRPSENVVNELGAASIMYDSRIIIFREETVSLATNYESIGYITFEHDDLTAKANDLFRELIAFGILKVSVSDD